MEFNRARCRLHLISFTNILDHHICNGLRTLYFFVLKLIEELQSYFHNFAQRLRSPLFSPQAFQSNLEECRTFQEITFHQIQSNVQLILYSKHFNKSSWPVVLPRVCCGRVDPRSTIKIQEEDEPLQMNYYVSSCQGFLQDYDPFSLFYILPPWRGGKKTYFCGYKDYAVTD